MKLFIWGTGRLLGLVLGSRIRLEDVGGFIDNDKSKKEYMGKIVIAPDELENYDYDAVLVANNYACQIKEQCLKIGINLKKVIFLYNNYILEDMNKDYEFIRKILGAEYAKVIQNRYHTVRGMENESNIFPEEKDSYYQTDYIRIKTFELAVNELKMRRGGGKRRSSRGWCVPGGICQVYQLCLS